VNRRITPRSSLLRRRLSGQALAETAILTTLLIGTGAALVYFFPDSMNALQIYTDGFFYVLSMPFP
jgi:hypothetical protein